MVETDAERMYVKLQKRQGRTDQPYGDLRMLEFYGGAVLVGNLPDRGASHPLGDLVDQQLGRAAWLFPDGSKLYLKHLPALLLSGGGPRTPPRRLQGGVCAPPRTAGRVGARRALIPRVRRARRAGAEAVAPAG